MVAIIKPNRLYSYLPFPIFALLKKRFFPNFGKLGLFPILSSKKVILLIPFVIMVMKIMHTIFLDQSKNKYIILKAS